MSNIIRVNKTNQNADDSRVLLVGALITIGLMVFTPKVQWASHYFLVDRPFVSATLKVVNVVGRESPVILYDADASINVDATWIGTIHSEDGTRLFTTRGSGSYTTLEDVYKPWLWESWFDNEAGGRIPDVPDEPFYVCVRYDAKTRETLVADESPEFCSNLYRSTDSAYTRNTFDTIVGEK